MSSDEARRWREIDSLFQGALDVKPETRSAYLDRACGGDRELRAAVERLLRADDASGDFLEAPVEVACELDWEEIFPPPGTPPGLSELDRRGEVIGAYRLLRVLGRGGMATVYLAERADGQWEQEVAVKIVRRGLNTHDVVRRFRAERQILSSLNHPYIAKLLDGGTTDDGLPFLVMEYVSGIPITQYCDTHALSIEQRLALFCDVGRAVQDAHRNLIVHRDLKPSNVLVAQDGQVKLLDFGIAKLLEPDSASDAPAQTTLRWMTPAYAAPEQILGRAVTTATDVHGLGVLLYELLSGRRPFGGRDIAGYDLARAVSEEVPLAPSGAVAGSSQIASARSTDPARLKRRLAGDLDAIVAKALRKEPEERYASVQALTDDIERHRAGFPVRARAGLRTYRARKFLRRHWISAAVAATFAAVLLGSSLVLWRALARADEAAARATQEAENARLITDFLADVFRGRDPEAAPSDTVTARELLAWGSERVDTESAERPALQASLLQVLGSAYANLGLLDQSVEHHRRAVELLRQVHGDRSEEVASGLLELSVALRANREAEAALSPAREALDIRLERFGPDDGRTAEAMAAVGNMKFNFGEPDSAEVWIRRALDVQRAEGGVNDSTYVRTLLALAPVRRAQGALDDAERLYEEAIPKFRAFGGAKRDLAIHLNNLAYLLRTKGEYARAEPLYREALDITTGLFGRGHPNSLLLANNLASVLHSQGDTAATLEILANSASAARAQWPQDHWRVGSAFSVLGTAQLRLGRVEDAFASLREARRIYVDVLGTDHDWTFFVEAKLAAGHVAAGRDSIGQPYLDQMYRYLRDRDRTPDTPAGRDLLGHIQPFVLVLKDLDLRGEAERFESLLPQQQDQSEGSG